MTSACPGGSLGPMDDLTPDQLRARLDLARERLTRRVTRSRTLSEARSPGMLARLMGVRAPDPEELEQLEREVRALREEVASLEARLRDLPEVSAAPAAPAAASTDLEVDLAASLATIETARGMLSGLGERGRVRPTSRHKGVMRRMDLQQKVTAAAAPVRQAADLLMDAAVVLRPLYGDQPPDTIDALLEFKAWADLGAEADYDDWIRRALDATDELEEMVRAFMS